MRVNIQEQKIDSYLKFQSQSRYKNPRIFIPQIGADNFIKSKPNTYSAIQFKGRPWNIPYLEVKTPYDAMVLFDFLKIGNYLDSSDDDIFSGNENIRRNNLGFLDALEKKEDKKIFIDYYQNLTGFPDLKKVSENIEREFILGIKKSSIPIEDGECIAAGYDETCSVGKKKAFPGSDLDKSFIILKGSPYNEVKDKEIVDKFKANLWQNIDQRILSFNHDISFPSIYTLNQIRKIIGHIDNQTKDVNFDYQHLNKLMDEEYVNLEKASEYNIKISTKFPVECDDINPSREDVKNFGYFIESVRDGKYLIKTRDMDELKLIFDNSKFYNYSNIAQTRAMKKAVLEGRENKKKIILRNDLEKNFNSWDINKQYDFIKTLIKYSSEDNDDYFEYFTNDRNVKDAYKPILNVLTKGSKDIYNRPEYSLSSSYLQMEYGENKSVNLYKGFSDKILWIDSNDSVAIKQVCHQINKIKQCELFKNIEQIQCIEPDNSVKGFYPILHKTNSGKAIYQKDLV